MDNETTADLTTQDISLLEKFKVKAAEFMQALDKINSIEDIPPNLQEEFSGLMYTAQTIQSSIGWITTTVDSVSGFFSDFFGFNGVAATRDYINGKPNDLGVVPLLPVAAISGAIALMSKFIADVYVFERKVTEQKRLEASGIAPQEAAKMIEKITGQTALQSLAGIAKPVGFALGAFFILKIAKGFFK